MPRLCPPYPDEHQHRPCRAVPLSRLLRTSHHPASCNLSSSTTRTTTKATSRNRSLQAHHRGPLCPRLFSQPATVSHPLPLHTTATPSRLLPGPPAAMASRPSLSMFTRGLSNLSQSSDPSSPNVNSPAEQRADSKLGFLKAMRPLPTQHYWNVYFDRCAILVPCPLPTLLAYPELTSGPSEQAAEGAEEDRRWPGVPGTARAARLPDRVRPGLLALCQQHPRRPDQDARVPLPVQAGLQAHMGGPAQHPRRKLDLPSGQEHRARLLDPSAADGHWRAAPGRSGRG